MIKFEIALTLLVTLFIAELSMSQEKPTEIEKADSLKYFQLSGTIQKQVEQEVVFLNPGSSLANPLKIGLLFQCSPYCHPMADIYAQKIDSKIAFSLVESELEKQQRKPQDFRFIGRSSFLFYVLQPGMQAPKYLTDKGEEKKASYDKFSRHLGEMDQYFKPIDQEILMTLQKQNWGIEGDLGIAMANRSASSSADIQSELSSGLHPQFQISAGGVAPWEYEIYGYNLKLKSSFSYRQSYAENSKDNSDKSLKTSAYNLNFEIPIQWNESLFIAPILSIGENSVSVSNSDLFGFGTNISYQSLGLGIYFRWFKFEYLVASSLKISDETDFRGVAEISAFKNIKASACPFSYVLLNYTVFPCASLEVHQHQVTAPGNSSLPVLDVESRVDHQEIRAMISLKVRQNMRGGIF